MAANSEITKFDKDLMDIKKALEKRKRELAAFDKKTEAEKKQLTEIGLNPYESEKVRARRKKAYTEKRQREFEKLPEKEKRILTALGFAPHEYETIERAVRKDIKL